MLIVEIVGGFLLGMSAIGFILLGIPNKALQNWSAKRNRRRDAEDRKIPMVSPALERGPHSFTNGHGGGPNQLDQPIQQDPIKAPAMPTDAVLVVLVESVHERPH